MDFNRAPQSVQELEQMANALANEMVAPLNGRKGNHAVILRALMLMHHRVASSMSAEAQCEIGFCLAMYAGDLIAKRYVAPVSQHEPHQFATDLPTAIQ